MCLGTSKLVRASSMPKSAPTAWLDHTFCPLITQRSPSALRSGGEPGQVRACAGLAEELAPGGPAVEDGWDEPLDLLRRALRQDRRCGHQQAQAAGRSERAERAEGGTDDGRRPPPEATAALFGREVGRRPAGLRHLLPPVVDRQSRDPSWRPASPGPRPRDPRLGRSSSLTPRPRGTRRRCRA